MRPALVPADALFWQLSIDHDIMAVNQGERASCRSIIWQTGKQRAPCCPTPYVRSRHAPASKCRLPGWPWKTRCMGFLFLCMVFFGLSNLYRYGASLLRPFGPPKLRYYFWNNLRTFSGWFLTKHPISKNTLSLTPEINLIRRYLLYYLLHSISIGFVLYKQGGETSVWFWKLSTLFKIVGKLYTIQIIPDQLITQTHL